MMCLYVNNTAWFDVQQVLGGRCGGSGAVGGRGVPRLRRQPRRPAPRAPHALGAPARTYAHTILHFEISIIYLCMSFLFHHSVIIMKNHHIGDQPNMFRFQIDRLGLTKHNY